MYLGSELSYDQLVAFVIGLELGNQPGPLDGFREFLVLKMDGGNNLVWSALAVRLSVPDASYPLGPAEDKAAVDGLFDLLDEFLAETGGLGARQIYREHFLWLQQQTWYHPELERFHSSPAPAVLALDEAAARLGVDRAAVFDLIASRELRPSRVGAQLLFLESQVAQLAAARDFPPTDTRP
jgi:excisionase family DNA binding protein